MSENWTGHGRLITRGEYHVPQGERDVDDPLMPQSSSYASLCRIRDKVAS